MTRHEERRKELLLAVKKIKVGRPSKIEKDRALSISSVADEVGIDPSTIHTRYPDIAELIRQDTGRTDRTRREALAAELREEKQKNIALRATIDQMKDLLTSVASKFASAQSELEAFRSVKASGGKVTAISGRRK